MNKQTISNILKDLGVTPGLQGYYYLREAIEITLKDNDAVHHITKAIYPVLAQKFKSKSSRVERDMRNALEVAWLRGSVQFQHQVFRYSIDATKGRPTNSEFIATVVDYLLLNSNKEE